MRYLWNHGVDIEQDAVIEAAMMQRKKVMGYAPDRNTMLKLIVMEYGEELERVTRELSIEDQREKIHRNMSSRNERSGV